MPTYEYVCKKCGDNFDVHQSFSDKPLKRHASCGGNLQKVFHARGIVFKGGGFYATDSRSSDSGKGTGAKTADSKAKDSKTQPKEKAKSSTAGDDS